MNKANVAIAQSHFQGKVIDTPIYLGARYAIRQFIRDISSDFDILDKFNRFIQESCLCNHREKLMNVYPKYEHIQNLSAQEALLRAYQNPALKLKHQLSAPNMYRVRKSLKSPNVMDADQISNLRGTLQLVYEYNLMIVETFKPIVDLLESHAKAYLDRIGNDSFKGLFAMVEVKSLHKDTEFGDRYEQAVIDAKYSQLFCEFMDKNWPAK